MIVQVVLNATDVRKHWSEFNDDVVREGPRFVKRNRDRWAALSYDHLKEAFSELVFNAESFIEEDGTVTVSLQELDIVENGNSEEEAIELIVDELIDYAHEYLDNFNLYFNSPNRRKHFKFILNVLIQDSEDDVKDLIKCRAGEI